MTIMELLVHFNTCDNRICLIWQIVEVTVLLSLAVDKVLTMCARIVVISSVQIPFNYVQFLVINDVIGGF